MQWTFLPFKVQTADIEEISSFTLANEIVCDLARQKAQAVKNRLDDPFAMILASDTIVILNNKIYSKPKDKDDARKMLSELSGKTHQVLTSVALTYKNKWEVFYRKTDVTFREISKDMMDHYLATGESMDKAGAYGIQGAALGFIDNINGSYSNVVGLPVDDVIMAIKKILGHTSDTSGEWRKCFQKV